MKLAENDPNHPYVKTLKGCGHGRLFTEPCVDCEIVGLLDEYKSAVRKVQRTRDRLRALGVTLPRNTSATQQREGVAEGYVLMPKILLERMASIDSFNSPRGAAMEFKALAEQVLHQNRHGQFPAAPTQQPTNDQS